VIAHAIVVVISHEPFAAALIVGATALFVSGLIFLLYQPTASKCLSESRSKKALPRSIRIFAKCVIGVTCLKGGKRSLLVTQRTNRNVSILAKQPPPR
jgi:hypothetical protein